MLTFLIAHTGRWREKLRSSEGINDMNMENSRNFHFSRGSVCVCVCVGLWNMRDKLVTSYITNVKKSSKGS